MRADDRDDFTAFVRDRSPNLMRVAFLLTGDRGSAEDHLQTSLEKTSRRWQKIREPEAAYAYVRRAMVNTSGASIAYAVAFSGPGDGSYGIYLAGWETYDSAHPLLDEAQLLRTTVSDGTATGQPVTSLLLLSPVTATSTLQAALSSVDGDVTEATNGTLLLPGDTDTTDAVLLDVTTGQTLVDAELMRSDYRDHYDYGNGPS